MARELVELLVEIDLAPRAQSWRRSAVVHRGSLHALLARLVNSGELQKQTLPTGRTGYALGQAQPEAVSGLSTAGGDAA